MPHLETAALGVWAGVGGRDEKPNEHGISHLLEHMAFKGTTRRSSREIVEEIEAVGGDLNAGTSTETTAYYARVMKADVPLALDVLSDILANPSFVPDELEREKSVIVQEIGAAQDTPDDVVFEHLNELCYPDQPMGRSLLGTAKTLEGVRSRHAARLSLDALSRPRHGGGRGRRRRSQAGGRGSGAAVCKLRRRAGAEAAAGDVRQGRLARGASRARAGASDAGAGGRAADRSVAVLAAGVHQHARRRHVVAAVPGGAREARAVLFDLRLPRALYRHRLFRPLYRHRSRRCAGDDGGDRRRHQRRGGNPDRGRGRARQGADEGGAVDGAGKLLVARRAAGAPRAGLWPAADGGGTGGEDRRRQRRIDAERGARRCCRAAGRRWSRSAAEGVWTRRWLLRKD